MDLSSLIDQPKTNTGNQDNQGDIGYLHIYSKLFKEFMIYVLDKSCLPEIRKLYPDLVIYFPPEVKQMQSLSDEDKRKLHLMKKNFNGWVLPGEE